MCLTSTPGTRTAHFRTGNPNVTRVGVLRGIGVELIGKSYGLRPIKNRASPL